MKRLTFFTIVGGCILAILCSVLRCCVSITTVRNYGPQRNVATGKGASLNLWVDPKVRKQAILGVSRYKDTLPYALRIMAYVDTDELAGLALTEAVVRYADGTQVVIVSPSDNWIAEFKYHEYASSTSDGVRYHNAYRLHARLERAIDRFESFNLEIRGNYIRQNGDLITVDFTETFRAEHERRTGFGCLE